MSTGEKNSIFGNGDEAGLIFRAVWSYESSDRTTDREVVSAVEETSFAPLLAEGFSAMDVAEVVLLGVTTVEGARRVLIDNAPVEWVRAWESGAEA